MAFFNIGDLISFSYPAVHLQGTRAHDKHPKLLVLHTNWEGLVHGLNFNYLTNEEINTVRMILDPSFEMNYRESMTKKSPGAVAEFDRIMQGAANANITSPNDFYVRVVRPFIITRGWDPYRLYRPEKMSGIQIVQKRQHLEGQPQGIFQKFIQKFQAMRGPQLPRFRRPGDFPVRTQQNSTPTKSLPQGPGALPGTRDDGKK
jgi:hypothetical protein